MSNRNPHNRPGGEIIVYQGEDGGSRIRVLLDGQTVWLTQALVAELYETTKQNISLHVRNISSERELEEDSDVKESLTTAADGKRYRTLYYSLPMITAVGYCVRSDRGTQFRQWATERLGEYLVKGFTLDDERLKSGDGLVLKRDVVTAKNYLDARGIKVGFRQTEEDFDSRCMEVI